MPAAPSVKQALHDLCARGATAAVTGLWKLGMLQSAAVRNPQLLLDESGVLEVLAATR